MPSLKTKDGSKLPVNHDVYDSVELVRNKFLKGNHDSITGKVNNLRFRTEKEVNIHKRLMKKLANKK